LASAHEPPPAISTEDVPEKDGEVDRDVTDVEPSRDEPEAVIVATEVVDSLLDAEAIISGTGSLAGGLMACLMAA